MPLIDQTHQVTLPLKVAVADKLLTRMCGLLGKIKADEDTLLHILPCKSVHTFGMQFALDVVALDREGKVVAIITEIGKNKIIRLPSTTHSVIEGTSGWTKNNRITLGLYLNPLADSQHTVASSSLRRLFHWPLNLFIALLWSRLVQSLFDAWQQSHSVISFGVLIHNTLLLVLFLFRRESSDTSPRVCDWLVPFATLSCAMLLRPVADAMIGPPSVAIVLQGIGIAAMIFSLLSLGRSFGIVPAHRRLQVTGAYRIVRHPLYTSEMIFYFGFLIGNFSLRNGVLIGLVVLGQLWRAAAEERLLMKDANYLSYQNAVRYRFLPGLF